MNRALLAAILISCTSGLAAQEQIKVKRPDFEIPQGILADVPADVPVSEIFVTEDLCFYYRAAGQFHFINCIG